MSDARTTFKGSRPLSLALFDLDDTLIAGDSDLEWLAFLAAHGWIDAAEHERLRTWFETEYAAGTLDLCGFARTVLAPLAALNGAARDAWLERFVAERIAPLILVGARTLLDRHRSVGDSTVLVTATNCFIAAPIARRLGIDDVLATPVDLGGAVDRDERPAVACFRSGKIDHVATYCRRRGADADTLPAWAAAATFYSDSHNDLALLRWVGHPIVVDPDPKLRAEAEQSGWPIVSLRSLQKVP